jgi:hypothetical protein
MDTFLHWIRRDYPPPTPSPEARQAKEQAERELIRLEALELEVKALENRARMRQYGADQYRKSG